MKQQENIFTKDISEMTDREVMDLRENYSTQTLLVAILDELQRIRRQR